jgi:hypothetical protein
MDPQLWTALGYLGAVAASILALYFGAHHNVEVPEGMRLDHSDRPYRYEINDDE